MELKPLRQGSVPAGYKQTEVGAIPEEWKLKRLGELGSVVRGGSPRPAGDPRYFDGQFIPWLTVAALTNIPEHQLRVTDTAGFLTEEGAKHSRTLERGTLIIANSGATLGIAKVLNVTCCANDGIAAIVNQTAGDKEFVCHYINSRTKHLREVVATGNGQPNLNTTLIREMPIPFPPPAEQRAIAGALSDVDALLGALDQLIAKKHDLKQATMQQLLTGQIRLPGFHGEWEVKRLGEIAMLYQPITISAKQFTESGYPVYGANGVVGFYREFNHDKRQVTVTCRGSTCGTVNRTVEKSWITGNAMVVNCDQNKDLNKNFLYYVLLSQDLSVCITGTGQPQIVRGPLANVALKIPRDVAEQTAIAEVLLEMDAELAALEQRRDKTRALKQGMMQELLTGKTRLVDSGKLRVESGERRTS